MGLPYSIPYYYEDNSNLLTNGYVPINIQKLREMGIREGSDILDYLVEMNIFETDGYYVVGEKSKASGIF